MIQEPRKTRQQRRARKRAFMKLQEQDARRELKRLAKEKLRAALNTPKRAQQEERKYVETQPGSPHFDGADAWNFYHDTKEPK